MSKKVNNLRKLIFSILRNFDDYFWMRNTNNKKEVEYIRCGILPPKWKRTPIIFSKKEATWAFVDKFNFMFWSSFDKGNAFFPIKFMGRNNDFMNLNPPSTNSENILLDDKRRISIFEYLKNKLKKK